MTLLGRLRHSERAAMRVLLLSAYSAQSHQHWVNRLKSMFPTWTWVVLELPGRNFSWRVRGAALYWARTEHALLMGDYDLILTTSMVEIATLRGLVPSLSAIPTGLYFHENQFVYPLGERQHSLLDIQLGSLYSALAADELGFNSAFNRDTFLVGCDSLLSAMPDYVPSGIATTLQAKSTVLPVPLAALDTSDIPPHWPSRTGNEQSRDSLRIVWQGRFEYDKGAEQLLNILRRLEVAQLPYEIALVGQQFRQRPAVFTTIEREFAHRVVHAGFVPEARDYHGLLLAADIVLSSALHEFQGLAVLEAVAAQCLPVVPSRLAYPEIYPPEYCYDSYPEEPELEAESAVALIQALAKQLPRHGGEVQVPKVDRFSELALRTSYRTWFSALARE